MEPGCSPIADDLARSNDSSSRMDSGLDTVRDRVRDEHPAEHPAHLSVREGGAQSSRSDSEAIEVRDGEWLARQFDHEVESARRISHVVLVEPEPVDNWPAYAAVDA